MNKIQPSGVGSKSTQIHQYAQFNLTRQIWPISEQAVHLNKSTNHRGRALLFFFQTRLKAQVFTAHVLTTKNEWSGLQKQQKSGRVVPNRLESIL